MTEERVRLSATDGLLELVLTNGERGNVVDNGRGARPA